MSTTSYISIIERYHEYRTAIHELMISILSSIGEEHLLDDKLIQCKAMERLGESYPFLELLYILDPDGKQISDNIAVNSNHRAAYTGNGKDRSQRPYYRLARDAAGIIVTDPYLSSANRKLCITAAARWPLKNPENHGYLVLDINLAKAIEFLMGDTSRRRFQPFFKGVYGIIAGGQFVVVAALLYSAFTESAQLFFGEINESDRHIKPFGVIIFLTLGLAVFDLGKTTLEEEVLMHKDIFRHSSTRRTITRFIAAILIAVSIEALLLMFKSALGDGQYLIQAVWMMLAAVGLLIGLGLYVFLGAKAEASLIDMKRK
jgi:hypothetical protein